MRNLWNPRDREALLERARRLTPAARPRWGRMTVDRMLCHVVDGMRMGLGELPTRSRKLPIGRFPLNYLIVYLAPWPKGAPTAPELMARQPLALAAELAALEEALGRFAATSGQPDDAWPAHPAFGRLSRRAWGRLGWRHLDHHLRQFGV